MVIQLKVRIELTKVGLFLLLLHRDVILGLIIVVYSHHTVIYLHLFLFPLYPSCDVLYQIRSLFCTTLAFWQGLI